LNKIKITAVTLTSTCPRQRQKTKREELDEQLREYIKEWRQQRSKEEAELRTLKERQVKRKVSSSVPQLAHKCQLMV
jgi:hypothetical protein